MKKLLLSLVIVTLSIANTDNICKNSVLLKKRSIIYNEKVELFSHFIDSIKMDNKKIIIDYNKYATNECDKYHKYKIDLIKRSLEDYSFFENTLKIFDPYYFVFLKFQDKVPVFKIEEFDFYEIRGFEYNWISKKLKNQNLTPKYFSKESSFYNKNENIIAFNKKSKLLYILAKGGAKDLLWAISNNTTLALSDLFVNGKFTFGVDNKKYSLSIFYEPLEMDRKNIINKKTIIKRDGNTLLIYNGKNKITLKVIHSFGISDNKNILLEDINTKDRYILKHIGFRNNKKVFTLRSSFGDDFKTKVIAYRFSLKELKDEE